MLKVELVIICILKQTSQRIFVRSRDLLRVSDNALFLLFWQIHLFKAIKGIMLMRLTNNIVLGIFKNGLIMLII
jgi:hypothetical protein